MMDGGNGDMSSMVGENFESYLLGYPIQEEGMGRVEESTGSNTTPSSQSPVWFETNDQQNFTPTTHNSPGNLMEFNAVPAATSSSFGMDNFQHSKNIFDFPDLDSRFFENRDLPQLDDDFFYFPAISNDTMGPMSNGELAS
jgi:hypothetical protein